MGVIYKEGLAPAIERTRVPVLAALAEAVSSEPYGGKNDDYGAIKTVLQMATYASAPALVHPSTPSKTQLREGLRELFDVGKQHHIHEMGRRQSNAADKLPYSSGDSFRNATRGTRNFIEVILDEITNQLVVIAVEVDFTYAGPLPGSESGITLLEDIEQRPQLIDAEYALKVLHLDRALFFEVLTLCSRGFDAISSGSEISVLAEIAQTAMRSQGQAESLATDLEAMLMWAIDRIDDPDRRQGTLIYLGLGEARGSPLPTRRRQAAPYFGLDEVDFYRHAEPGISIFVRQQVTALVSEMDQWPAVGDSLALQ